MSEKCCTPENGNFREAVCIHTDKVYDSCKDKDCIEDARVYFSECDTEIIEKAISIKAKKAEARPTEYDVLACLQKYDVGSMDDFFSEFGYEIKCVEDMTNFINTYNAVVKEYNDVRRCFTEEQIEVMWEIQ